MSRWDTRPDLQALIEDFQSLEDWEDRYALLLDLGRALPILPDAFRTEEAKVRGCVSQVWVIPEPPGPDGHLRFQADSDSPMVRGLIGVLRQAFHDQPRGEARGLDVEALFRDLQLEEHLSPNRRNGFFAMVGRLKALAGEGPDT